MAKVKHIIAILLLTQGIALKGQLRWHGDIFSGIKYGLVNTTGGTETTNGNLKQVSYNLGKGFCHGVKLMFNRDSSASGFALGFQYSKGARAHYNGNTVKSGAYDYAYLENQNLQLFAGCNMLFNLKKVKLLSGAGILLPVYNRSQELGYQGNDTFSAHTIRTVNYRQSLGLELQQQIHYHIQKRFSLYAAMGIGLLSINRKSSVLKGYNDSRNRSLDEANPNISSRYTYYFSDDEIATKGSLNNPVTNKGNFDINKPIEAFMISEPFSYLMISMGFTWHF